MVSSVTTSYASTSSIVASQSSRQDAAKSESSVSGNGDRAAATTAGPVDIVTISAAAKAPTGAKDAYYGQFFPTHEGFSSTALAAAVSNPGQETFSAGKDFRQVAGDARRNLDEKYQRLEAGGKAYDYVHATSEDVNSLYGDLDRRALYAVSSNEGGQFTDEERDFARSIMLGQQGLAMGAYAGPSSQQGKFVDPFGDDHASRFKAAAKWLDGVSNDEKATSVEWAVQRASAQFSYELIVKDRGGVPENIDSESPLVKLIKGSMDTMRNDPSRGTTYGPVTNTDQLKAQPWFKGFEEQLDGAMAQAREIYKTQA